MLSVKQAAEKLGVSVSLTYSLITGRRIRHFRVGNGRGRIRIPEEAIGEYLARVTFAPEQEDPPLAPVRVKLKHLRL